MENINIYGWEIPYVAGVSVFLFFPVLSAGVCQSECVWRFSVLCCDVLFVCAAGSVTVLTVGCCYTADWVFCFCCVKLVLHSNVAVHCKAFVLLIGVILRIAIPLQ